MPTHQRPQMEHSVDTGPNNPEQYHLSIGGRLDKCIAFFPTHLSPLFIPLLLPRLLFILMWSGWSSWWWHGVDYAVPTVTYSKAAEGGTIVVSDLCMTALPVAPAPHWRCHGERGAGRACRDVYSTCQGCRYGLLKWNPNTRTIAMSLLIISVFVAVWNIKTGCILSCIRHQGKPHLSDETQDNDVTVGWAAFKGQMSYCTCQEKGKFNNCVCWRRNFSQKQFGQLKKII